MKTETNYGVAPACTCPPLGHLGEKRLLHHPSRPQALKVQLTVAASDPVTRPAHYCAKGIEVIDVIEAFDLNYRLGNVVEYVLRHDGKGEPLQDLRKARWYLDREIARREEA